MSEKHDRDRTGAKHRRRVDAAQASARRHHARRRRRRWHRAAPIQVAQAQQQPAPAPAPAGGRTSWSSSATISASPNVSAYSFGVMGYRTPNIDRIAREGMMFTDYYAEQSCTAGPVLVHHRPGDVAHRPLQGRAAGRRPSACSAEDITIAEALKPLGYATGQFGKNHLGDRNEFLPTVHGFDEFFGNLYHLNAEEEPENPDYPQGPGVQGNGSGRAA